MKTIELSKHLDAIVDDNDYYLLSMMDWRAVPGGNAFYAHLLDPADNTISNVTMQEAIVLSEDCAHIRHINGNGLDNRRANLTTKPE